MDDFVAPDLAADFPHILQFVQRRAVGQTPESLLVELPAMAAPTLSVSPIACQRLIDDLPQYQIKLIAPF
jgi:hypothetical protein